LLDGVLFEFGEALPNIGVNPPSAAEVIAEPADCDPNVFDELPAPEPQDGVGWAFCGPDKALNPGAELADAA
jgi:hypothetical protein